MAVPYGDANDINTVLRWAMNQDGYRGPITDQAATEAARRIMATAYRALGAGLRPEEVTLSRAPAARAHLRAARGRGRGPACARPTRGRRR
jgi:hypothetical protein